jgi:hypothetical protein
MCEILSHEFILFSTNCGCMDPQDGSKWKLGTSWLMNIKQTSFKLWQIIDVKNKYDRMSVGKIKILSSCCCHHNSWFWIIEHVNKDLGTNK